MIDQLMPSGMDNRSAQIRKVGKTRPCVHCFEHSKPKSKKAIYDFFDFWVNVIVFNTHCLGKQALKLFNF